MVLRKLVDEGLLVVRSGWRSSRLDGQDGPMTGFSPRCDFVSLAWCDHTYGGGSSLRAIVGAGDLATSTARA